MRIIDKCLKCERPTKWVSAYGYFCGIHAKRMSNKVPVATAAHFEDLLCARLMGRGATHEPESPMHQWTLQTKAGPLKINVCFNVIFQRFEIPEGVEKFLGLDEFNPYSGKWNLYLNLSSGVEACLAQWERQIARVTDLPAQEVAP